MNMRGLPWLILLSSACTGRAFEVTSGEQCGFFYTIEQVAEGEPVQVDWTEISEDAAVDRVVLGRLPFSRREIIGRWCQGTVDDFEWSEIRAVELGATVLDLAPEDVGEVGTTTVVTLRSLDEEVSTVGLSASAQGETTHVRLW